MPTKDCYHKLKSEGRCTNCGKKIIGNREGMVLCEKCAILESFRQKKLYYEDRDYCFKHGICPVCKRNKIFGDERNCPECRAKKYNHLTTRLENDPEYKLQRQETSKRSTEKRITYRRANNLCLRCGKPLTDEYDSGFVNCKQCRVRNMIRNRNYRANHG